MKERDWVLSRCRLQFKRYTCKFLAMDLTQLIPCIDCASSFPASETTVFPPPEQKIDTEGQ